MGTSRGGRYRNKWTFKIFFFFFFFTPYWGQCQCLLYCSSGSSSCYTVFFHGHVFTWGIQEPWQLQTVLKQSGWKLFHVLIIFLIYCDIKWKREHHLLFLCEREVMQPFWTYSGIYFHIYIKRILEYVIACDPANTNSSMILS